MTAVEVLRSPTASILILLIVVGIGICYWYIFLRHEATDDIPEIKKDLSSMKKDVTEIKVNIQGIADEIKKRKKYNRHH